GKGDGTLRAAGGFEHPGCGIAAVAIADFNADGHPDIAGAVEDLAGAVSIRLWNGAGGFGAGPEFGCGPYPVALTTADFNADGRPDLAVANAGSHSVSVLLNQGAPPPRLGLGFRLSPGTLEPESRARWVTGFLEPAAPLSARDIDIASIRLNGSVPVDAAAPTLLADHDGNGIRQLAVKFDRAALSRILA